ncbi:MAG: response regulator transcription factor [Defluviitaleaceae bacterium]|nr:response regulator transcription factor [Defluviitaleaceae bacterium]
MKKQLIYTAEDDDSIRELITYAITNEGYDVRAFSSADTLLQECEKLLPDLILLDIMMAGTDGIKALKDFRQKYKSASTSVIMLTAKASEMNKIAGLDAGADDYITKPFSVLELMARIRANLRKKSAVISSSEIIVNSIVLNQESRVVLVENKKITLTNKEFELLKYLMLNVGNVVERDTLLKEIWGYEYFGETRTIDIHMKNLREKLGTSAEAIQSVRGVGYILTRI